MLNSDLWVNAVCDSDYMDKVFVDLIPTMTSNSTPEGMILSSTQDSSRYPYYAFDKVLNTHFNSPASMNIEDFYLTYMFQTPKKIAYIQIATSSQSDTYYYNITKTSHTGKVCRTLKIQQCRQ